MLASKKQEWVFTRENAPQINEKRQAPKAAPSLNKELRKQCCAFAVLLLLLAGIATLQTERIVSAGYQCIKLQKELTLVEQNNEKLRVEIARLKSLDRIQMIAANNLGMIVPNQVLEVPLVTGDSGKLAVMQQEMLRRKL